jgi:hypothetical protein
MQGVNVVHQNQCFDIREFPQCIFVGPVMLFSISYTPAPISVKDQVSRISTISGPLKCLGGLSNTILAFLNASLSNIMGDPGAKSIYDNQSKRSSPPNLRRQKMCPSYILDMSEFHCNSTLKRYCTP